MTALLQAATSVLNEIEVEFPNLFGGVAISYYRGFMLFGKLPIYWYGVIITLGVILAYFYAMHRTKDFGLNKDRVFDVVFAALSAVSSELEFTTAYSQRSTRTRESSTTLLRRLRQSVTAVLRYTAE